MKMNIDPVGARTHEGRNEMRSFFMPSRKYSINFLFPENFRINTKFTFSFASSYS